MRCDANHGRLCRRACLLAGHMYAASISFVQLREIAVGASLARIVPRTATSVLPVCGASKRLPASSGSGQRSASDRPDRPCLTTLAFACHQPGLLGCCSTPQVPASCYLATTARRIYTPPGFTVWLRGFDHVAWGSPCRISKRGFDMIDGIHVSGITSSIFISP